MHKSTGKRIRRENGTVRRRDATHRIRQQHINQQRATVTFS